MIKTLFRQQFRVDKSNKGSKSAKIGMYIAFGIIGIFWFPIIGFSAWNMSVLAIQMGVEQAFLSIIFMGIQIVTLIFGTIMLVNTMFFSRDNEFLSVLPIKPQTIFFSKLAYVIVNELMLAGTMGLIAIIIFGIVGKMGVAFYLLGFISIILAALLPLLVSSLLLFPLMYIMSYIKRSTTLSTIISIGAFLGFMVGYMYFIGNMQNIIDPSDPNALILMIENMGQILFFNYSLAGVVLLSEGLVANLLITLAVYAGAFVITYFLSAMVYKRGLVMQSEKSETKVKAVGYEQGSLISSLMKKDFKEIKRDTSMLFQCGMTALMAPLMIALIFGMTYKDMGMDSEVTAVLLNTVGVFFLILMTCGSNVTATSSISRENRCFHIMKIIPVPYEIQIKAKQYLSLIFAGTGVVLGGIVCIAFGMNILTGVCLIINCLLLSYGMSVFQIKMDLDRPKLNWDNFAQAIKNSRTAILTMLVAMVISIVAVGLSVVPIIFEGVVSSWMLILASQGVLFICALLFSVIMRNNLNKKLTYYFDKIEV